MEVQNSLKEFVLSTKTKIAQILSALIHQLIAAQNAAHNSIDWALLVIAFCLTSSVDIALQLVVQTRDRNQLPMAFHMLSITMVIAFSLTFVAKHIATKFPNAAKVLEQLGALSVVLTFYLAITLASPLYLKLVSWAMLIISLLVILICNGS